MARHHGVSATTYNSLIIDSGAVYTGFTTFSSMGTLIGATRGYKFEAVDCCFGISYF